MNRNELYNYIKEHGITKARTTEDYETVPKSTELWFGINDEYISTFNDDTDNKNKDFGYDFYYQLIWGKYYKGQFELVDNIVKEKDGIKVGDRVITKIKYCDFK